MKLIDSLVQGIAEHLQGAEVSVDPPTKAGGSFWVDVRFGGRTAVIEWRPSMGFGVSSLPSDGYGEGPDEVYHDVPSVISRMVQLLQGGQRTEAPQEASLQWLREIRRISQEELAGMLGIKQAAVSRLERREDMNVSSLQRLIVALGGELQIYARFPEYTVQIKQFEHEPEPSKG